MLSLFEFIDEHPEFKLKYIGLNRTVWSAREMKLALKINDTIIKAMGYTGKDETARKKNFVVGLNRSGVKYLELNNPTYMEYRNKIISSGDEMALKLDIEKLYPDCEGLGNKTRHYLVEVGELREFMMTVSTEIGKEIRKDYLKLEDACHAHQLYVTEYRNNERLQQIEAEILKIKSERTVRKKRSIIRKEYTKREYVYIAGSDPDSENEEWKFGRTENPKSRLGGYNCGAGSVTTRHYYKLYPCNDSIELEYKIKQVLEPYCIESRKEMYQIPYDSLVYIVSREVERHQASIEDRKVIATEYAQHEENTNKKYTWLTDAEVDAITGHDVVSTVSKIYSKIHNDVSASVGLSTDEVSRFTSELFNDLNNICKWKEMSKKIKSSLIDRDVKAYKYKAKLWKEFCREMCTIMNINYTN